MTVAICYKCGAMKVGAFSVCKQCGAIPSSEDDYVVSLSMTDHYFDISTLEEIGRNIAIGKPPHLDPESRRNMIQMIRSSGMLENAVKAEDISDSGPEEQNDNTNQPEWVVVNEFGDNRTYVDRASLQRNGSMVMAKVRYALNPPGTDKRNGKPVKEMLMQEEYDISAGFSDSSHPFHLH